MFEFSAILNTSNRERLNDCVTLKTESNGDVSLLSVCADIGGLSDSIDADKGIEISVKPKFETASFMADYRYSEYWCRPHFGYEYNEIPNETQHLIIRLEDERFCVLLPLVNSEYKCVIEGGCGHILLRVFSWCRELSKCEGNILAYAIGDDPEELTEKCLKAALSAMKSNILLREEREYPEIFEYLGWCTWDSMQIRVSEEGILKKCKEFSENNIPIKWLIIDDMWAEIRDFYGKKYKSFNDMIKMVHSSRMYDYKADPIRFPNGLKGCIGKVKEYGLSVGIWHPTTGYWAGFDPEGDGYAKLKDTLMLSENGRYIPDWHRDKSYSYYDTLHTEFKDSGADFVKIDNQSMTRRFYKYCAPVGDVAAQYHEAMEDSAKKHFGSGVINCMGMASEDIFNRRESPVCRCSNDFLPENRDWFTSHVLQCAYNSILLGKLYWCDWDMWWSDDSQAVKNSLMRAISGGPVYVSDKLNRSRKEIFSPLATEDGRVLRCDRPCTPTADCITVDPTTSGYALKLQNIANDCGVMALLNLDVANAPVKATVSPSMIKGLSQGEYAVYEHFSGTLGIMDHSESFDTLVMNSDDLRLYIFVPVVDGFAAIGRVDKFISPKTIECVNGRDIKLIENGRFAYYADGEFCIESK